MNTWIALRSLYFFASVSEVFWYSLKFRITSNRNDWSRESLGGIRFVTFRDFFAQTFQAENFIVVYRIVDRFHSDDRQ